MDQVPETGARQLVRAGGAEQMRQSFVALGEIPVADHPVDLLLFRQVDSKRLFERNAPHGIGATGYKSTVPLSTLAKDVFGHLAPEFGSGARGDFSEHGYGTRKKSAPMAPRILRAACGAHPCSSRSVLEVTPDISIPSNCSLRTNSLVRSTAIPLAVRDARRSTEADPA